MLLSPFLNSNIGKKLGKLKSHNYKWLVTTTIAALALLLSVPSAIYYYQQSLDNQATDNFYYVPGQHGNLDNINIEDMGTVNCWTTSHSSTRSDAFRCSTGSLIYDPCFRDNFTSVDTSIVECPASPYEQPNRYIADRDDLINENEGEKAHSDNIESVPWHIVLDNGVECSFLNGATISTADRRVDYGCQSNDDTEDDLILFLPLDTDEEKTTIGCLIENRIDRCSIKEVWY